MDRAATQEGPYGIGSSHIPGLSKLIEEAGELTQVAGKIIGLGSMGEHWDGTNLRDRAIEEIGDLYAALDYFCEENGLDATEVGLRRFRKLTLFREWSAELAPPLLDLDNLPLARAVEAGMDGFGEDHSVGASRSSVKRSHRAEGRNFID